MLPRPVFVPGLLDQLPGWVFSLVFVLLGCHHIAIALWYIMGRILTMCFAHMRPPTPMSWVFPPTFLLPRPVSAPRHINQLPGWAFLLAFHSLRPRRGFPRLLFYFHAQFSFQKCTISFRDGFSRLFLFSQAHVVGFPAYFSTPTPSFRSWTA